MLFIYIISAATLVKDNKCTLKRVIMECIGGGDEIARPDIARPDNAAPD